MITSIKRLSLASLFFTGVFAYASAQDKIALLVGVSNYPAGSGWNKLNAGNDIRWMKNALLQQGFPAKDIAVLENEKATRRGILYAIENHLLKKARPGAVAVFLFAGHGQQVYDDNGDEGDGYDEALVPYDASRQFRKGVYEGVNHLRDDELGVALNRLRQQLGSRGNLLTVLDACHSGSATRGQERQARGYHLPLAPDDYLATHEAREADEAPLMAPDATGLAPAVLFSSTRAHELNSEVPDSQGNLVGPLSYALSKALSRAQKHTGYRALFDQARVTMNALAPAQHPQAEGQLDQEILGGRLLGRPDRFTVAKNGWLKSQQVRLDGGQLLGLFPGTTLDFHPVGGIPGSSAALTTGTVLKSGPADCIVQLQKPLSERQAKEAWVFIREQTFGDQALSLRLDLPDGALKNDIRSELDAFPMIALTRARTDLEIAIQGQQVCLFTHDGLLLRQYRSAIAPDLLAGRMVEGALEYARCRFFQQLELKELSLDLRLELVKVQRGDRIVAGQVNTLRLRKGEAYRFRVTNTGSKPAYFSILDINPEKTLKLILPDDDYTPEELYLEPGKTWETRESYGIDDPLGTGVLKLVVSQEVIDLRPIEKLRGQTARADDHPFAKFFGATFFYENRGKGGPLSISPKVEVLSFAYEFVR